MGEKEKRKKIEKQKEFERQKEIERQNEFRNRQEKERLAQIEKQKTIERQKELERQANFERNQEIERQREAEQAARIKEEQRIKKEKERERLNRIQKEKEDIERKKALQRKKEIEKQKEEERRRELERAQELRKQQEKKAEKERPRQSGNNKQNPFTDSPAPARTLPQSPVQNKEEVTTFGPFSAFKNFPSFPRNVLDDVEQVQEPNSSPVLRGPNLLPTRPTGPPPSNRNLRPPQQANRPPVNSPPGRNNEQRPNGPPRPGPTRQPSRDELRFIPSPPLRDPVPPVSVFLPEEDGKNQPSVFLPPQNRRPPSNKFKDNFFSVQTQLGQTNTRIPPNDSRRPPKNQPFTFFGQSFPNQNQRPASGPVSFPGQPSQQGFPAFNPRPPPPARPAAVNSNIVHDPNSQSSSFLSFNSNNFRQPPVPTGPEKPRSLQSVFGGSSSFQSAPFQSNTFFNQGARFESRPNPNSLPPSGVQTAPGSTPVQRQNPPRTVFNLPAGTQRLSQQQNFPGFPQPQFGGFRPIKRHLQVDSDEEEIFAEDLPHHGSRQKKRKNKHANGGNTGSRSKSHVPSSTSERADLANTQQKLLARARAQQAARRKMQAALKNELAKVYFEEFAQKDNEVEYYEDDDYYYYEYLD